MPMPADLSRRSFVAAAAGAAAWTMVNRAPYAQAAAVSPDSASPLMLGVASYSLREFTLERALEMAHTLGVKTMTFKDVHIPRTDPPEVTRALRAKIEAAGIRIMGGGTITLPNEPPAIEREFEYAKNAGFPLIFVSPD